MRQTGFSRDSYRIQRIELDCLRNNSILAQKVSAALLYFADYQ